MKSKLVKVFYVVYSDDNTKEALMSFDISSLTDNEIQTLIADYLKDDECLKEVYDNSELEEAANTIANNDSWYNGTEEYFLQEVTEYYNA